MLLISDVPVKVVCLPDSGVLFVLNRERGRLARMDDVMDLLEEHGISRPRTFKSKCWASQAQRYPPSFWLL